MRKSQYPAEHSNKHRAISFTLGISNTRELLLQFAEHQKGVRAVLVDVASPDLLHSVGADCTVFTYDLRKERRTVAHM